MIEQQKPKWYILAGNESQSIGPLNEMDGSLVVCMTWMASGRCTGCEARHERKVNNESVFCEICRVLRDIYLLRSGVRDLSSECRRHKIGTNCSSGKGQATVRVTPLYVRNEAHTSTYTILAYPALSPGEQHCTAKGPMRSHSSHLTVWTTQPCHRHSGYAVIV